VLGTVQLKFNAPCDGSPFAWVQWQSCPLKNMPESKPRAASSASWRDCSARLLTGTFLSLSKAEMAIETDEPSGATAINLL